VQAQNLGISTFKASFLHFLIAKRRREPQAPTKFSLTNKRHTLAEGIEHSRPQFQFHLEIPCCRRRFGRTLPEKGRFWEKCQHWRDLQRQWDTIPMPTIALVTSRQFSLQPTSTMVGTDPRPKGPKSPPRLMSAQEQIRIQTAV